MRRRSVAEWQVGVWADTRRLFCRCDIKLCRGDGTSGSGSGSRPSEPPVSPNNRARGTFGSQVQRDEMSPVIEVGNRPWTLLAVHGAVWVPDPGERHDQSDRNTMTNSTRDRTEVAFSRTGRHTAPSTPSIIASTGEVTGWSSCAARAGWSTRRTKLPAPGVTLRQCQEGGNHGCSNWGHRENGQ